MKTIVVTAALLATAGCGTASTMRTLVRLDTCRRTLEGYRQELTIKNAMAMRLWDLEATTRELVQARPPDVPAAVLRAVPGATVRRRDGWLVLRLPDRVLFRPGEAELTSRARQALSRLDMLRKILRSHDVAVIGHVRGRAEQAPQARRLSLLRAAAVARFLEQLGAPPVNLVATGRLPAVGSPSTESAGQIEIVTMPRLSRAPVRAVWQP